MERRADPPWIDLGLDLYDSLLEDVEDLLQQAENVADLDLDRDDHLGALTDQEQQHQEQQPHQRTEARRAAPLPLRYISLHV